jgi:hypothetical protein
MMEKPFPLLPHWTPSRIIKHLDELGSISAIGLEGECLWCGAPVVFSVPLEEWEKIKAGLIKDLKDRRQRELFASGFCFDCQIQSFED